MEFFVQMRVFVRITGPQNMVLYESSQKSDYKEVESVLCNKRTRIA